MRNRTRITARTFAVAAAAAAIPLALTAPAMAQDEGPLGPTGSIGGLPNLPGVFAPGGDSLVAVGGSPSGTCWGAVSVGINGDGYPGSAVATWNIGVLGFGDCGLHATLHWTNLDEGTSGEQTIAVDAPQIFPARNDGKSGILNTGVGDIEYTLTTDGGAHSDTITVHTDPYDG
ncbi:hypothetical protein [Tomitella fengzijianii]|uniref:Uncharacterized protein n=1 Tax=Tomitella fengzijianii TaxID=2597660 RepID=A0A516X407_9ACTN|nr:hypothetical protein [Tomitella fengzijianii]QDQ97812.1 hypothetical protein FO059_11415 [Tomitella fengzijianii]